jgi:hypothetical protein
MSAFGGKADIGRVLTEIKNTGDRAEVESLATAVFFESQRTRGDNSGRVNSPDKVFTIF